MKYLLLDILLAVRNQQVIKKPNMLLSICIEIPFCRCNLSNRTQGCGRLIHIGQSLKTLEGRITDTGSWIAVCTFMTSNTNW